MRHNFFLTFFIVILWSGVVHAKGEAQQVTSNEIKGIANNTLDIVRDIVPALIGNPGAMTKGFNDNVPLTSAPPTSLVDYFERIYWPRMISSEQLGKATEVELTGLKISADMAAAEAQNMSDYTQDIRAQSAQVAQDSAGVVDVLCGGASKASSLPAARIIDETETQYEIQVQLTKMGGSFNFPETANGPVTYYRERVKSRQAAGYGDPTENNGASDDLYDNGVGPALVNADMNPQSLLQTPLLIDDQTVPNNPTAAQAFINNVFSSSTIFTPLRKEQLKEPLDNAVSEVLSDRYTLGSQIGMFLRPFQMAKASRTPIKGTNAEVVKVYRELLREVGISSDDNSALAKLFIDKGELSKESMEELYFRTANLNPKAISRLGGWTVLGTNKTLAFSALKQQDMVVMLYDIREEQRETNRLLAAIGGLLASDRNDSIEAKTRAIASQ